MWATDYPHVEGTWPCTRLVMRNTFARAPEARVRAVLGDNAVRVCGLDADALGKIADDIGPTVNEIAQPLTPEEFPSLRSFAFREVGISA